MVEIPASCDSPHVVREPRTDRPPDPCLESVPSKNRRHNNKNRPQYDRRATRRGRSDRLVSTSVKHRGRPIRSRRAVRLFSRAKRRNPALDLFGEVPVTWDEVYDWVELVAGIPRDSWRAPYYIKNWNVIDKIREAKKAGYFDEIYQPR
jgi:hypothetical protein